MMKQGIRRTLGACLIILLVAIAVCSALDLEAHLVFLGCIRFGFTFVIAAISYLARTSQLNALITASCVWACSYLGYSAGGFVGAIFPDAPIGLGSTLALCSLIVIGLLALIAALLGPASRALPELVDKIAHLFSLSEIETSRPAKIADNATSAHTDIASTAEIVAADFNLSKRETDVFVLLAQGRDTNYIAQTLFISANTTKMHRKNIYRKMEVHSQQDIIDLVLKAAAEPL